MSRAAAGLGRAGRGAGGLSRVDLIHPVEASAGSPSDQISCEESDTRSADKHKWRPDIQGLRAIAVLSVVMFHLGFWPLRGGFVGVDVFFVISGYLISQGIFVETAQFRFSLLRFYERRARRLLPVFLVTVLATTVLAFAVLLPAEFVNYAQSLVASSLFAANIYFFQKHNYFGPSPDSLPLLHLWSLGIEEQFYIVFPLLAFWVARFAARQQMAFIVLLGLGSFGLSTLMTHRYPTAAFYLLPFRAFELLTGSYLALPETAPPQNSRSANVAGWIGLAALVAPIVGFSTQMDFPGAWAAMPCLGTGLLIWAGTGQSPISTRLLSTGLLTFVGNISYSLYMVHWPLIVINGQLWPDMHPALRIPLLLALSVLISVLLFYAVEEPIRRTRVWRGPVMLVSSAASLVMVAFLGLGIIWVAGFPGRIKARSSHYVSYLQYDSASMIRSGTCFMDPDQEPAKYNAGFCLPKAGPEKQLAVLWGDSVAAHLYPGLSEALARHGFILGQATASACPPTIGYDAPQRPFCEPFNARALALMLERKPALVIMASLWGDLAALDHVKDPIERLQAASIQVILLGPAAYYRDAVPKLLARRLDKGIHGTTSQGDMADFVASSESRVRSLAVQNHFPFVSILGAYCSAGQCPMVTDADVPIEFDPLHFTLEGSHFVADKILPLITRSN